MDLIYDGVFSMSFAAGFVIVVFAAVVQSTSGIGFGLIAAPLLVLIDPKFVPGTVIFLGVSVSFLSALRDMRDVNPTVVQGVPRIWERIHAAILIRLASASRLKKVNTAIWVSGVS